MGHKNTMEIYLDPRVVPNKLFTHGTSKELLHLTIYNISQGLACDHSLSLYLCNLFLGGRHDHIQKSQNLDFFLIG